MSEKQEEESGLDQLARGRMTTLDESDKALHLMCKMLCEGLPEIDEFDELAHKLTPEDDRIYGAILKRHCMYFGAGLGVLDYAQDIRRIRVRIRVLRGMAEKRKAAK